MNSYYHIFRNVNGYFEEINKTKNLTLVPSNKSKEKIKSYKEMWSRIRNLTRSITKNSDDHEEKNMKIKFNSDNELPLNKTRKIPTMATIFRANFYKK